MDPQASENHRLLKDAHKRLQTIEDDLAVRSANLDKLTDGLVNINCSLMNALTSYSAEVGIVQAEIVEAISVERREINVLVDDCNLVRNALYNGYKYIEKLTSKKSTWFSTPTVSLPSTLTSSQVQGSSGKVTSAPALGTVPAPPPLVQCNLSLPTVAPTNKNLGPLPTNVPNDVSGSASDSRDSSKSGVSGRQLSHRERRKEKKKQSEKLKDRDDAKKRGVVDSRRKRDRSSGTSRSRASSDCSSVIHSPSEARSTTSVELDSAGATSNVRSSPSLSSQNRSIVKQPEDPTAGVAQPKKKSIRLPKDNSARRALLALFRKYPASYTPGEFEESEVEEAWCKIAKKFGDNPMYKESNPGRIFDVLDAQNQLGYWKTCARAYEASQYGRTEYKGRHGSEFAKDCRFLLVTGHQNGFYKKSSRREAAEVGLRKDGDLEFTSSYETEEEDEKKEKEGKGK